MSAVSRMNQKKLIEAILAREDSRDVVVNAYNRYFGALGGRPKVMKQCPACAKEFSTRGLRAHRCAGKTTDRI